MTDPEQPMDSGSAFLRRFYGMAGVAYVLMAPLLGLFALMTPKTCASSSCVESTVNIILVWTAWGAITALALGTLAFFKRNTNPRWLTLALMTFPFVFWLVYWLLGKAAGVM